jgi:hypothetical protein
MRARLVKFIIDNNLLFSLMFDESTTISNKTLLVIYLRCMAPDGSASNVFLALVELPGTTGQDIATAVLDTLESNGFPIEFIATNLVAICADGASNMQGPIRGAAKFIADALHRDDIIKFHCFSHKLELAAHDAVDSTQHVLHQRCFMDTLYAYYSQSPKNAQSLEAAAAAVGGELKKIGRVFDVRWLSSTYSSVDAVWCSYPALLHHLRDAENNEGGVKKSKAKRMVKRMRSWEFVGDMALLRDALDILRDLSLYLQKREASVVEVKSHITIAHRALSALKEQDGASLVEFSMTWPVDEEEHIF